MKRLLFVFFLRHHLKSDNQFSTQFSHYYINTLSHILWTYLLRNCLTDCRHFWHVGALWSNVQHRLCEIAPDGQVWEFLAIF